MVIQRIDGILSTCIRLWMIMQQPKSQVDCLADVLKQSINLLVVDDYPVICNAIVDLFSSPLFNTSTAASAREARALIAQKKTWHCWVLDISLEEEYSGINLLADYPQYPFVIMLSGMRSMSIASRAMQLGAYKVFDKDPQFLPVLHADVCRLAALSYVLRGSGTKYLSLFSLLAQMNIDSAETWAKRACMTVRQLERICSLHSHLTPRFIIPFYYTLQHLLQIEQPQGSGEYSPPEENGIPYRQHIEFVTRHLDTIIAG